MQLFSSENPSRSKDHSERTEGIQSGEKRAGYDGGGSLRLAFAVLLVELLVHILGEARLLPDFIHGILPRTAAGAPGILFAPFLHANWEHLFSNAVPLFLSIWGVSYLYRPVRWMVLIAGMLLPGLGVWFWDDPHIHLGASGWIYALLAFLFWSGIVRRNPRPIALSLIIVFLYGGMIWRMLPLEEGISWQSHLLGGGAGLFLALLFYRVPVPDPFRQEAFVDDEEVDESVEIDETEQDFHVLTSEESEDWSFQRQRPDRDQRS
ncbi:MAG: rhomboid family intramembrane serine protease [Leptospiraceae bacterium]|nr:rhomboid family intramembrane serine protease [Leptospiraceae bacterium]